MSRNPRFLLAAAAIILGGGAWRAVLAERMPCLARDGVLYIDFARTMEHDGLKSALRDARFQQHPLFSVTTLLVHRAMRLAGMADTPMTWQRAGQAVAWLSGTVLIIACGWLASRVRSDLQIEMPATRAVLISMVLAALLPLNTWLSADVMSDQLHGLLYVLAIAAGLRAGQSVRAAVLTGLLGGLAFLVRPEGMVVCLAAGLSLLVWPRRPVRQTLLRGGCLVAAFLLLVCPYWLTIGGLTPKLGKETVDGFRTVIGGFFGLHASMAALIRRDVTWPMASVQAAYELLRAGRVVVPVLAIGALVRFVPRWREPGMFVPLCAGLVHWALANVLLVRHGYLQPRHLLVIVLMMIPWAALALAWVIEQCRARRCAWVGWLVAVATWLPLAAYSTRVPNGADRDVAAMGRWLADQPSTRATDVLLGGASERRIAFYGGVQWRGWPENTAGFAERYTGLREDLLGIAPGYFAITTGGGSEVSENQKMLDALRNDAETGPRLRELHVQPGDPDGVVYLFRFE